MFGIMLHRASRLPSILVLGAALVLAGSALAIPAPVLANGPLSLFVGSMGGQQPPTAGVPYAIWVEAGTDTGFIGINPDTCFTDNVHFSSSDGAAGLPANYTFQADPGGTDWYTCGMISGDLGIHHFVVVPHAAGHQTITVSDASNATIPGATLTIDVAPGPAASLTATGMPVNAVRGADTQFRVTAWDAFGNVATGYTGTVNFESTDLGAGLSGSHTFNAGDAGTRLFSAWFYTVGGQSVTVTDNLSHTAYASTIVVQAPHFDVQCYDGIVGVATSCSVTARTQDGAIDTGYTGSVHFTSSDPYGGNLDDYTFQAGQRGEAEGFAPMFETAGVQTLTATDKTNGEITGAGSLNVLGGDTVGASIVGLPSAMVAGQVTFTVNTADAYGNWGSGGAIHFTSDDTRAVLPADFTFHGLDYGTHQFTATLKTPGTTTLTVSGSDYLGPFTTSASITVMLGAATHLSVVTTKSYVAGAAHSVTVKALDAGDNVDPTYRGTINFTSSDPKAVKPLDYTFTLGPSGDDGLHVFSYELTFKTAGTQWVRATDTDNASITGQSTGIVVAPAAASTLSISTLATYVAGASHSVTVKALDAYGNVATGYHGTIHFTASDKQASVPADYTFTTGTKVSDNGVHVFATTVKPALTFKTAGKRWVRATDTAKATITGVQIVVVTPNVAKTLTVSSILDPYPAGSKHSVKVTAVDAYGNVAVGYTGTIHFTTSDPAAGVPSDFTFGAADKGAHTFANTLSPGLVLRTPGSQWVRATDTGHATITGAQTVTVQ